MDIDHRPIPLNTNDLSLISKSIGTGKSGARMRHLVNE
jgi:hypothetical protein